MIKKELSELTQHIELNFNNIDNLLDNKLVDEAYSEFTNLVNKIESTEFKEIDGQYKAKVYTSFAYFLFSLSEFNSFFEMLIKAQEYEYPKDEIEKILFEAFVEPNINEFKLIYESNIRFLQFYKYINIEKPVSFEDLSFWLLPNGIPNEYYLYNKKQQLIQNKITLYTYQKGQPLPTLDAFSDYLLLEDWDWSNVLAYTNSAKRRKKTTYVIIKDIEKFLSCLQGALLDTSIISNVLIFDNLNCFSAYLSNSNLFIPRNIINLSEKSPVPQDILDEIHNNRLHKKNRIGDRVLLSICIPSYNRGKRAYENILHLLQSYYDEEIEIILSNNGTQNETKVYYDRIKEIEDGRLKYFAFEENQGFSINCCKACELASGEFILLLSDEDLINFKTLHLIMSKLYTSKDTVSVMKTSSSIQYKLANLVATPGREAMLNFMLSSNYMSGIILNNKFLKMYKGIEYVKENLDNSVCFWYPHMFWELLLCQYGVVESTDLVLVIEGKAEQTEVDKLNVDDKVAIPYYATIESRLEQHAGFTRIFNDLEISTQDPELFREMYTRLCGKTMFLTTISINVYYKKTNTDSHNILDRSYNYCLNESFYKTNIDNNDIHYLHDLKIITQYYEHYKKTI